MEAVGREKGRRGAPGAGLSFEPAMMFPDIPPPQCLGETYLDFVESFAGLPQQWCIMGWLRVSGALVFLWIDLLESGGAQGYR